MAGPGPAAGFLEQAEAALAVGRVDDAVALFDQAITLARTASDLDRWTRALLGTARMQRFGPEPGRLPALLAEALAAQTADRSRAQLAAALARTWAYAGQPRRAAPFAAQALEWARGVGEAALVADAIDAALTARWGPDELDERGHLARELDDVTAHLLDPDARLQAHLWGLTVAFEHLDVLTMNRQVRALELLGEESEKARFFAASRRLVLDLMRGRLETAGTLIRVAEEAVAQAHVPDGAVVLEAMRGYSALHAGDGDACARAAAIAEDLADAEGLVTVAAEATNFWVASGRLDRAGALVSRFFGRALAELPRDVDWLLVMQCVLDAALATGRREVVAQIVPLLTPYSGRAVVNAGAVMFHGVTDDPLSRGYALLGDHETAGRLRATALATYERAGAHWWHQRLSASPVARAAGDAHTLTEPLAGTLPDPAAGTLPNLASTLPNPASTLPNPASTLPNPAATAILPGPPAGTLPNPATTTLLEPAGGALPGTIALPGTSAETPAPPAAPTSVIFRRLPDGWEIGPPERVRRLPALRGLDAVHRLVSRPGRDIAAIDLVGASAHPVAVQAGLGPPLDDQARRAYRNRLRELDEELAEADAWADAGRATRLRLEREALIGELTAAFGLGGVPRNPGSTAERARVTVRKAIVNALDRLAAVEPATARHLRTYIRTGLFCRYEPDPDEPRAWVLT